MVRRRLLSWWWDFVVVLAWLLIVLALVGVPILRGWIDLSAVWSRPVAADVAVTLLTVVPFLLYLVATETGRDTRPGASAGVISWCAPSTGDPPLRAG